VTRYPTLTASLFSVSTGILLDAFQTKCSKCTEAQKTHIRKAANFFITNVPEQWQKVVQKYDPEGKHADGFKQFLQGA
jgi:Insect pheromone-binding family, A10/OS-D.